MFNRIVLVLLLLGAGWFLVNVLGEIHEREQRIHCASNMRQIGLAMHNFHDSYEQFPDMQFSFPSQKESASDEPEEHWHSWRLCLVPYIEQNSIYDEYSSMDEAWHSPDRQNVMRRGAKGVARYYRCPSREGAFELTGRSFAYRENSDKDDPMYIEFDKSYDIDRLPVSDYLAVVDKNTVMRPTQSVTMDEITDGRSNTILLIESARSDRIWTEPRDLPIESLLASPQTTLRCHPQRAGFFMKPFYGANVVMADGSVQWIPADIPADQLRALLTINGDEKIDLKQIAAVPRQLDWGRIVGFAFWWLLLAVLGVRWMLRSGRWSDFIR